MLVITFLITISIPSRSDTLLIYFIPKIANSETIVDIADITSKLPKVLQKELNKYLKIGDNE